ncbi:hypothetical protein [Larkinella terrae]|uniref:Uncharacterized protein n=1 Tax=Larkinella terrae TaxID=2025311 RepID=A0A7K0EJ25_9BACT|nr:hypothetical protein [Larkinella terrae]MRS61742.1 hypothetical protein [Larkinella terrae]
MLTIFCKDKSIRILRNFHPSFQGNSYDIEELARELEGKNYLRHEWVKVR